MRVSCYVARQQKVGLLIGNVKTVWLLSAPDSEFHGASQNLASRHLHDRAVPWTTREWYYAPLLKFTICVKVDTKWKSQKQMWRLWTSSTNHLNNQMNLSGYCIYFIITQFCLVLALVGHHSWFNNLLGQSLRWAMCMDRIVGWYEFCVLVAA